MHPVAVREEAVALVDSGLSMNAVSKKLGVSRAAIREWRDRGIIPRARHTVCFRCHDEAAPTPAGPHYAALFGFYLGDGSISRMRSTYTLRIFCTATYPRIVADVTELVEALHAGCHACHVNAPGVVVVQNSWNHWPCLFPQHGPGRKHERTLVLQDWQRKVVHEHPADFLRGLFHSDGSRTKNWATRVVAGRKKRYEYPRWEFVNYSADIQAWCKEALDLLAIPWRQPSWRNIAVSTRAGVARLDELVGLKN